LCLEKAPFISAESSPADGVTLPPSFFPFPIMDDIDKTLLALLQENVDLPLTEIAERVKLSMTPCWRRIQRLEKQGYIQRRVALLDPVKLNVGVTVFVLLSTNRHNQEWFEKLRAIVADIPEVVDFYRMSGNIDYLLRIVVPDIAAYDAVYRKLTSQIEIFGVNSSFAMEEIKHTTALPLEYIKPGD
jgi:Lrp/AsnC family transcriptional regulator